MTDASSYRRILKASSITGGGAAVNILAGLFRAKLLALMLGATGIGLLGLYTQAVATGATLFGLGLPTAGVRAIAAEKDADNSIAEIRDGLIVGSCVLALIACAIVWLCQAPLAQLLTGSGESWLGASHV